jgi:hypothetical protein
MKIKIVNNELPSFDHDLKVKNINFDMVLAEEDNETLAFEMEDVELVPESKYEELILNYKDILKIKLCAEVSPKLYAALIECIEQRINGKLKSLEVLRDDFKISKRGIWEKRLILVINNSVPLDVTIIGVKYADEFNITFKDIALQSFIEGCCEDVKHLRKEIEEKEKSICRYKRMLNEVLINSASLYDESKGKLLSS